MNSADHWDEVYRANSSSTLSWYQASPHPSLKMLDRVTTDGHRSLIDVGGGSSTLVDALLERGWIDLTILDIAAPALEVAQQRLGRAAQSVDWKIADITCWRPQRTYDVWHDRAVFHFLTSTEAREGYKKALTAGTVTGSIVIIATFALEGPEKCSGLVVRRYNSDTLAEELGSGFQLLSADIESHSTPGGSEQVFNWCLFKRIK